MDVFGTAFIPGIQWFQLLIHSTEPVIDLGEHFIKQTQRNRGIILSSNGQLPLIIPLRKSDSRTVGSMEISYSEDWQTKGLRAIRSSYMNSPYYEHYQEGFEELFCRKEPLLHEYNKYLLDWIIQQLDMPVQLNYSMEYVEKGFSNDYRLLVSNEILQKEYKQVFSHKMGFVPGLSVIDLLFNKGPESLPYLQ